MAQAPKQTPQRRAGPHYAQEEARQRLVVLISAGAIAIALLSVLAGVLYDRVWLPSRPVAQVGTVTLTRGDYNTERRNKIARDIVQNLQINRLFGAQAGDQFTQQILTLNEEARTIAGASVDEQTIADWANRQVILQNAASQGITPNQDTVTQVLMNNLTSSFPPPAPPVSGTLSLSATVTLPTEGPTSAPTQVPQIGTTPSPEPTPTSEPTPTPEPTLTVDQAKSDVDALFDRLYQAYELEINRTGRPTGLTRDNFRTAMQDQYTVASVVESIQASLVPDASFTPTTDPSAIETRQIILKPKVDETASEAQRVAAIDARKAEIDAIYTELQGGADFATLATEKSENYDTQGEGGTVLPFDQTGKTDQGTQIDPEYVKQTLALAEGAYSQPFRTSAGWHIVQLVKKTVPTKEEQLQTARQTAFETWLTEKQAALPTTRFPAQSPIPTTPPTAVGTAEPLPTFPLGGVLTESVKLATEEPAVTPTTEATVAPTSTTAPTAAPTTAATAAPTP